MTSQQAPATAELPHFPLVIDGQRTEAASGRSYPSIDPYLGAPWATAADGGAADVDRVVGPDVPFGGFGVSGLGRENGIEAVHEYTQTKAIWVELSGGTRDPFTLG